MSRGASSTSDVLLYFLAIWLPFVPVFIKRGCGADLLINICLDILGWIPGVLHAWYIISKTEDRRVEPAGNYNDERRY
ncbi:hypothetical protein BS50DRAFT_534236 [Corynespora cassiicola Philippines]|uniref:Uncharacterized protein n=1 Tax=Corynespora cassiicola Philippines TaxID=1448308 RepID=A0A2T2N817_CORCC|nr:hypothetical protein BS50DRAFT_534236 [Corynespora cassiicola Philippines]